MMSSLALMVALLIQGSPSGRIGEISGRVLLQDGAPAAGVRVSALEVNTASSGQSVLASSAATDTQGRYRLTEIPPGRYYIQAVVGAMPTYYPGVFDRQYALAVTVSAGAQVQSVEFSLAEPLPPPSPSRSRANQEPCGSGTVTSRPGGAPLVLAADRAGNVFFAEAYSNVVRRVSPDGKVSIVAGNGLGGHDGDGGPATAAALGPVNALAADFQGNLYIAEGSFVGLPESATTVRVSPSPRIRKVTPSGTITTVAGNGSIGRGGDGGPATAASLCPTTSLAADGLGNIFIGADPGGTGHDFVVRKVDASGNISTIPQSIVYRPDPAPNGIFIGVLRMYVAADTAGNVFIVGDGRIQRIAPSGVAATLTTVDRTGVDSGVATDGAGNLFLADSGYLQGSRTPQGTTGTVQKLTPSGVMTTVAGDGGSRPVEEGAPALLSSLRFARPPTYDKGPAIAADGVGNVYIAEGRSIRKITPDGVIFTLTTLNSTATNSRSLDVKLTSAIKPTDYAEIGFSGRQEPAPPAPMIQYLRTDGISRQLQTMRGPTLSSSTNGEVEIPMIAPGAYEIFVSLPDIHGWGAVGVPGAFLAPRSYGRASVLVRESAPNSVTVTVHPGVDLNGRVFVDGQPASPAGLQIFMQSDSQAAAVDIYANVGRYRPPVAQDGTFKFPALPEARYAVRVEASGQALIVEDILLEGQSVKTQGIAIDASSMGVLEIRLRTTRGGQ